MSLASSFRIASGTSSPCSFVDTRSGEGGAGVDGSHALCQLVGGDAVHDDDESAVRDARKGEEEPGIHFANLSCSPWDVRSAVSG